MRKLDIIRKMDFEGTIFCMTFSVILLTVALAAIWYTLNTDHFVTFDFTATLYIFVFSFMGCFLFGFGVKEFIEDYKYIKNNPEFFK